jgi:hypothetical protein
MRANRRSALVTALGEETLSRAELTARTGLNDQTVRRWLTIMRDEGSVELIGSKPAQYQCPLPPDPPRLTVPARRPRKRLATLAHGGRHPAA